MNEGLKILGDAEWPYLPTIIRLLLALALGVFVGMERERRRKEAGIRTFGFVALLGSLGGLLGEPFALLSLGILGILVVFLNIQTIRSGEGAELTTSAALFLVGFAGILCGQGHTLTPTAVAVIAAAMLAWKEPLAGFTLGLEEKELRSAILLAILALVVYPALPVGTVDPWNVIDPRSAWLTVLLIAAIGFVNYILWKIYGARGILLTGFLGGLVNSTVTVNEFLSRVRETGGNLDRTTYRGILFATGAMLIRNALLLCILAPRVFLNALLPLAVLLAVFAVFAFWKSPAAGKVTEASPELNLTSPFSLISTFKFGLLFLAIQIGGIVGQRSLGNYGFYTVSFIGGLFSSSSSTAAAASLFAGSAITLAVATGGAILASLASVLVNLPLVLRVQRSAFTWRIVAAIVVATVLGISALIIQQTFLVLNDQ